MTERVDLAELTKLHAWLINESEELMKSAMAGLGRDKRKGE